MRLERIRPVTQAERETAGPLFGAGSLQGDVEEEETVEAAIAASLLDTLPAGARAGNPAALATFSLVGMRDGPDQQLGQHGDREAWKKVQAATRVARDCMASGDWVSG